MTFRMDDYVDVAERIREFYERFPEGSLQSGGQPFVLDIGGKPFIAYHALAFRTPDDPRPAHGWAWEPVPGPTQFTRDSELMNAETAAWGRAIVAAGFSTKKIASQQEVRARQKGSAGEPKAVKSVSQAAMGEPASPADSVFGETGTEKLDAENVTLANTLLEAVDEFHKDSDEETRKTANLSVVNAIQKNRGAKSPEEHRAWLERQLATTRKNIETKQSPFQEPKTPRGSKAAA